jgi:hypothetical protein
LQGSEVERTNWMRTPDPHPISPELVLVDPELAARVRATAIAGPSYPPATVQARVLAPPAAPASPTAAPARPPRHEPDEQANAGLERRHGRRRVTHHLGSIAAALAVIALLAAGFLPPRQAPHLGDAATAAATPPTLAWRSVGAKSYRVEIYAGERLVHAETIKATHLDVPRWLAPRRYTWRVFVDDGARVVGQLTRSSFEEGWFVVRH